MDVGCCIYAVLWDIYINVFPVSAYNTVASSFGCFVVLHNAKLCTVYDCVRHSGPGRNTGQLALQYIHSGRINVDSVRVGNCIYAWQMPTCAPGLDTCTHHTTFDVICGYEDKFSHHFFEIFAIFNVDCRRNNTVHRRD